MKKVALILHDIEKLNAYESISLIQVDALIDSLHYTPFKQYLLCLKVGVKPEDATVILLKYLVEDIFEKTSFAEIRIHTSLGDIALQETAHQAVMIIAKPLFKVVKDENGQINGLKSDALQYENYETIIGTYLTNNEYIIITNFRDVLVFDKEATLEFEPLQTLSFVDLVEASKEKKSLFGIAQSFEKTENQEVIIKQFTKTVEKLAEGKEIDFLLFFKFAEAFQIIPYQFLNQLFVENKRLWESQGENIVFKNFIYTLTNWLSAHYALTISSDPPIDLQAIEKLIFAKSAKIKNLSDYNYRKINAFVLGKTFENLYNTNNDFPEEIYDAFCENLVKQLFENQITKVIENIEKGNLKKVKQFFEDLQKKTISNPFFDSGIVISKLLKAIFEQYQRIENCIDTILNQKQDLLDKDENWNKLATLKEELGFNDLRKFIIHIVQNQLFIDSEAMPISQLSTIAKLNTYISAIRLAPSVFAFRKAIPQDERFAFKKFDFPPESSITFSSLIAMIPLANWKRVGKMLIINFLNKVEGNGFLSLVLPAEALFGDSDVALRQILLIENTVIEVITFEQGKITWSLLMIQKKKFDKNQTFFFKQWNSHLADEIKYANELITGFSPANFHIIKFAKAIDYQICSKIKAKNPTLGEANYTFKNEFKLSNDTNFFLRTEEENTLPLYEGREEIKYFIPKEKAHNQLLSKEINALKKTFSLSQKNYEIVGIFNEKNFSLDYQSERLVVKKLQTDAQFAHICTLIPANTFVEASLLCLSNIQYEKTDKDLTQHILDIEEVLFLLALLNSWVLNFYAKATHLIDISFMPFPKNRKGKDMENSRKEIIEKASQLYQYQSSSNTIRIDLENQIAQELYGLDEEEFAYVKNYFEI